MRTPKQYTASDGTTSWRLRFRLNGRDTSETFDTLRAAETFSRDIDYLGAQEAVDRLYAGDQQVHIPTVDDWAEEHFRILGGITEGTRRKYRNIYAGHWADRLGRRQLHTITRGDIQEAVNDLSADGMADKTVANVYGVIATMFKEAVLNEKLARTPCRSVKMPRRTEHEAEDMVILDTPDLDVLVREIPDHYRPLVTTLAWTGMRWGEAAALTVGDASRDQPTIRITKAVKDKTHEIGPPKTRAGRRTIWYNDIVADALEPLLDRPKRSRLFTAPKGGDVQHRTFWSDIWRPAVWRAQQCPDHIDDGCRCGTAHPKRCTVHETPPEPCGCPGTLTVTPRIHDLRHMHASMLLANGVPIDVVSERLGHSDIQTTVNVYGHLRPDVRRLAAQVGAIAAPERPAIGPA